MQVLSYLRNLKKRDRARDASRDNDWDFGARQIIDITTADAVQTKHTRRRSISLNGTSARPSLVLAGPSGSGADTVARVGEYGHGHGHDEVQQMQVHSQASLPPQHLPGHASQTFAGVDPGPSGQAQQSHSHSSSIKDLPRPSAQFLAGANHRASASLAVRGSKGLSTLPTRTQFAFPQPRSDDSTPRLPEEGNVLLAAGETAKESRGMDRRRRAHSMAAARLSEPSSSISHESSSGREGADADMARPKLRHASSTFSAKDIPPLGSAAFPGTSSGFEVQQQRLSLQPAAGPSRVTADYERRQTLLQAKRSMPQLQRIRESLQEESPAEALSFDFPIPPQSLPVLHGPSSQDARRTGIYSESTSRSTASRPTSLLSSRSRPDLKTSASSITKSTHAHTSSTSSAISGCSSVTTPTAESVSFASAGSPPSIRHRPSPSVASTSSAQSRPRERPRGHARASHLTHQTTSSSSSTSNSFTGSASSSSINAFLSSASSMTTVCDEDDECETLWTASNDGLGNPAKRNSTASSVVPQVLDPFRDGRNDIATHPERLQTPMEAQTAQVHSPSTLLLSNATRLSLSTSPHKPHSIPDAWSRNVPVARGITGSAYARPSKAHLVHTACSEYRDSSPSPSRASFTSSSSGTARSTPTPRTPGLSFLSASPEPDTEQAAERHRRRLALYEIESDSDALASDSGPEKRERGMPKPLLCSREKHGRMSKTIFVPSSLAAVDDDVTTDDENDVLAELGYYTSSTPSPRKETSSSPSPQLTSRRSSRQLNIPGGIRPLPRSRSAGALRSKHVGFASVSSVPLPSPVSPTPSSSSSSRSYHRPFASTANATISGSSPTSTVGSFRPALSRTSSAGSAGVDRNADKKLQLNVEPASLCAAGAMARNGPLTPSPITAGTSKAVEWGYAL